MNKVLAMEQTQGSTDADILSKQTRTFDLGGGEYFFYLLNIVDPRQARRSIKNGIFSETRGPDLTNHFGGSSTSRDMWDVPPWWLMRPSFSSVG